MKQLKTVASTNTLYDFAEAIYKNFDLIMDKTMYEDLSKFLFSLYKPLLVKGVEKEFKVHRAKIEDIGKAASGEDSVALSKLGAKLGLSSHAQNVLLDIGNCALLEIKNKQKEYVDRRMK